MPKKKAVAKPAQLTPEQVHEQSKARYKKVALSLYMNLLLDGFKVWVKDNGNLVIDDAEHLTEGRRFLIEKNAREIKRLALERQAMQVAGIIESRP